MCYVVSRPIHASVINSRTNFSLLIVIDWRPVGILSGVLLCIAISYVVLSDNAFDQCVL